MTVTIAGCGALGSLLAARLIEGGVPVQAYQRQGAQLEALRRDGITIEADRTGTTRNFQLQGIRSITGSPERILTTETRSPRRFIQSTNLPR